MSVTTIAPDRPLSLDLTPTFPITYPSSSPSSSDSSLASEEPSETTAVNDVDVTTPKPLAEPPERGRSPHSTTSNGGILRRASSLPSNRHRHPLNTTNIAPPILPLSGHYSLPASAIDSPSLSIANSLQSSPGTSTSSLNVKFAPLPEIPVGRKRKNTTPLGVAHRGAMMRRRRGLPMQAPTDSAVEVENAHPHRPNGLWTHEEVEAQLRRQAASQMNTKSLSNEPDDPLVVFGRKLKGVLRKVSSTSSTKAAAAASANKSHEVNEIQSVDKRIVFQSHEPTADEGEGRVWEEEVSQEVLNLRNNT